MYWRNSYISIAVNTCHNLTIHNCHFQPVAQLIPVFLRTLNGWFHSFSPQLNSHTMWKRCELFLDYITLHQNSTNVGVSHFLESRIIQTFTSDPSGLFASPYSQYNTHCHKSFLIHLQRLQFITWCTLIRSLLLRIYHNCFPSNINHL